MPKQQAVLSPEVAIDTKACQVRSFAIPYAVQIIEHRMWLSAVSDWPFQGCTVAFTLTKKSLCGEWLALWLLEIVKKDLRKQFASCSRRLSCFWALKPLLSTIYLYMCMYRCIYTQILCVWGTRTLCTSPSFFFFSVFCLTFFCAVTADENYKMFKYDITDSTCPSAFLAWEHQHLLDIDCTVTEHQHKVINLLQISCECNLGFLMDVGCS